MRLRRGVTVVALGLAVAGLVMVGRTRGQTRVAEPPRQQEPDRQDRSIHPSDHFFVQGYESNVDSKWETVLVDVPAGRWLTVTDMSIGRTPFAQVVSIEGKTRRVLFDTATYRDKMGPWSDPKAEFASYQSSVGITIPPGARLIIRNGGAGNSSDIGWHVTGFYEDE